MSLTPFLMFEGNARNAIDLYLKVIPRSNAESIVHWNPEEAEQVTSATGSTPPLTDAPRITMALVNLDGLLVRFHDTPIHHQFTFTPAISLYFATTDLSEYETALLGLADGGVFLMEDSDSYGFATRYAWLNDRFGVSWQLAFNAT